MSKLIDINNYEEFALDYLDGSLSPELSKAFESFLIANPSVAEEIDQMREFNIPHIDFSLDNDFKSNLKIEIKPFAGLDESNYENQFALSVDSDINSDLLRKSVLFVEQNPLLKKDLDLYLKSKLVADSSVLFPSKSSLRKVIPLWDTYTKPMFRVAAAFILLFSAASVFYFLGQNQSSYSPRMGANEFAEVKIESISIPAQTINSESEVSPIEEVSNKTQVLFAQNETDLKLAKPLNLRVLPEQIVTTTIDPRELANYSPGALEPFIDYEEPIIYASANEPSPVLNLPQFIGQKLLGIEPKDAKTSTDLIKSGIRQAVARNELVQVNRDTASENRKMFELIAGKFEFTIVNYK